MLKTSKVVSVVNGVAISKEQVRALMRTGRLTAEQALRALQDELVLQDSAKTLGFDESAAVWRSKQQLMVQALLDRDVERLVTPGGISNAELEEAYRVQADRFSKQEARMAVHILARVAADEVDSKLDREALGFIRNVIDDLKRSDNIETAVARYNGLQGYPFRINVERLPPLNKKSPVLKPFIDALFGMKQVGIVPEPVRTTYGWHAIVLYEIQPASTVSLKDATATLREEIVLQQRKSRLETLLGSLKKAYSVQLDEAVIRDVLRADFQKDLAGS